MAEKGKFWLEVRVGVVVALAVIIVEEVFTGGWIISTLWKVVKAIGGLLGYPVSLPLWAVVLLPIFGAGVVIGLQVLARRRRKKDEMPLHAITRDRIFDIDWEWFMTFEGISDPLGLCPKCKNELSFRDHWARCSHCEFEKFLQDGTYAMREEVEKEIRRRFRTGERGEEPKKLT